MRRERKNGNKIRRSEKKERQIKEERKEGKYGKGEREKGEMKGKEGIIVKKRREGEGKLDEAGEETEKIK